MSPPWLTTSCPTVHLRLSPLVLLLACRAGREAWLLAALEQAGAAAQALPAGLAAALLPAAAPSACPWA